jgi:hypothetical protein
MTSAGPSRVREGIITIGDGKEAVGYDYEKWLTAVSEERTNLDYDTWSKETKGKPNIYLRGDPVSRRLLFAGKEQAYEIAEWRKEQGQINRRKNSDLTSLSPLINSKTTPRVTLPARLAATPRLTLPRPIKDVRPDRIIRPQKEVGEAKSLAMARKLQEEDYEEASLLMAWKLQKEADDRKRCEDEFRLLTFNDC